MDRNVVRYTRKDAAGVETTDPEPPPHEKLLKYFPEAALALYIGADPLVRQAASGGALELLLWLTLGATVVFCWMYLARFWTNVGTKQKVICRSVGDLRRRDRRPIQPDI